MKYLVLIIFIFSSCSIKPKNSDIQVDIEKSIPVYAVRIYSKDKIVSNIFTSSRKFSDPLNLVTD